jgi:phage baseplate assembly protein W
MTALDPGLELIRRRRSRLGWGLACAPADPSGRRADPLGVDLVLVRHGGTAELAQVEGVENLRQSLQIALTTLLGSDVFNTAFGFDGLRALAEETSRVLARERIRVAVIQTLRQDPRVREIVDLHVEGDDPTGRTLAVRVTFETVGSEPLTVELGGALAGG